jgi:predicted dehydrogenase
MNVAMIGAGGMAKEHLKAFRDIPGTSLAGIFSRTRSKAEALAREMNVGVVCDSIPELYEKTRADLVVIAVPELAANSVARAAFEFPWTVLMEKPAGYNLEDATAIAAAAAKNERRVYVGLNRRFLSSTRAVLNDVKERTGPRFIQVFDQQSLETAKVIGHPPEVVANWMYANSIHVIDYLRLFGRGRISAVKPIFQWNKGAAPIVAAGIEFESGDKGLYEGIWNGPGPWAVNVNTSGRRWELRPLEQAVYQNAGERKLQNVESHAWDRDFKPGFRLQAEQAAAAVKGLPTELPTIDDALETMRLIASIFS